jgi:hypothetical protein
VVDLGPVFADPDIATNQDELTYSVTNSNPALVTTKLNGAQLTLDFAENQSGAAIIIVRATDRAATFAEDTFRVTVNPVNDAPSFARGADQVVDDEAGAQSVSWATAINAGPASETAQTLSFELTNDNPALFTSQPTLSADGTLTYTPASGANGSATITVVLKDSGGRAESGSDTSAAQTFVISVAAAPASTPESSPTPTTEPGQDATPESTASATPTPSTGPALERATPTPPA